MKVKTVLTTLFICFIGLVNAQDETSFEHSFWQWVNGSEITDKRLNEVAPHFPNPEDFSFNTDIYDEAVIRWQKLYCLEYEALINAEELIALNPYYDGYQDIIKLPYFIRPLSSFDKPVKKSTGNEFNDQLEFELDLQAWYFVFDADGFYQKYKIKPTFPSWFDAEAYKAQIVKKIEETSRKKSNQ